MTKIDVIVKYRDVRLATSKLRQRSSERLALPHTPFERRGKHESFTSTVGCFGIQHITELALACIFPRMHGERRQPNPRRKAQNPRYRLGEIFRLRQRSVPVSLIGEKLGREYERRRAHAAFRRPPTRSYFTMVASTSTMARTASSAVMSEIS